MAPILKYKVEHEFHSQIINMSHIRHANKVVKEKLSLAQLDLFRRTTIFRCLVDLDLFNNPLVHYILQREVIDHITERTNRTKRH